MKTQYLVILLVVRNYDGSIFCSEEEVVEALDVVELKEKITLFKKTVDLDFLGKGVRSTVSHVISFV